MTPRITAARLLELAPQFGIDFRRTADNRVRIIGPRLVVDALEPQLHRIGRAALITELDALDVESRRRLARFRTRGAT